MFNKKIIFSVIVVIIAGAGVLGYLEYKKNRVENPGGQTTGINTSDWLTYRNEEYGFELKYPGDWEVDSRSREKEFIKAITFHCLTINQKTGNLILTQEKNNCQ